MREPVFSVFIGVDQTGAVRAGDPTRARPLDCAILLREPGSARKGIGAARWVLRAGLKLDSLSKGAVLALLSKLGRKPAECALLVDCVFGLERAVRPLSGSAPADRLWARLSSAREVPVYGRLPAEAFFARILEPCGLAPGSFPRRPCELLARANSVFQSRPYQKNIQTGTFRIWKDLASEGGRWLNFWPFETEASRLPEAPWIFEGFPSLFWRGLLRLPTRDLTRLRSAVRTTLRSHGLSLRVEGWGALERDTDAADAAILALGGLLLQEEGRLHAPFSGFRAKLHPDEGWIAGLPLSPSGPGAPGGSTRLRRSERARARARRPRPRA